MTALVPKVVHNPCFLWIQIFAYISKFMQKNLTKKGLWSGSIINS